MVTNMVANNRVLTRKILIQNRKMILKILSLKKNAEQSFGLPIEVTTEI